MHLLEEPCPTSNLDLLGDIELVLRDHVKHLGVDEVKLLLDHGPEVVEQLLALVEQRLDLCNFTTIPKCSICYNKLAKQLCVYMPNSFTRRTLKLVPGIPGIPGIGWTATEARAGRRDDLRTPLRTAQNGAFYPMIVM